MSVKLLTEHHLEFQSLKGYCTCSSESTLVKMPHCWKSHVAAHIFYIIGYDNLDQVINALLANTMFMGCFSALLLDNLIPGKGIL